MTLLQISHENEKFFQIIKSVFLFSRKFEILCKNFNIVAINKGIPVSELKISGL